MPGEKKDPDLHRRLAAEALGTGFLLVGIVGSRIAGARLMGGEKGLALIPHALAAGAILMVMIFLFEPISRAHFNPAVSLAQAIRGKLPWRELPLYVLVQLASGLAGTIIANAMFAEPLIGHGGHNGLAATQLLGEFIGTFGLLSVILGTGRVRPWSTPFAVGFYIMAATWFTPSTSFANPTVTFARVFTAGAAGVRPLTALCFIGMQLIGAIAATLLFRWLTPETRAETPEDDFARPEQLRHVWAPERREVPRSRERH